MRERYSHSKLACKYAIGADDHEYALFHDIMKFNKGNAYKVRDKDEEMDC